MRFLETNGAVISSALVQPAESWFVAHTRSRHEQVVAALLQKKGVAVFLPKRQVWSQRRDRRKKILVPLFPGYVFVGSSEGRLRWMDVLYTRGVVRLLGGNACPTPVSPQEIESVQTMVENGEPLYPLNYLVRGDRVRVVAGPLEGVQGVFLRNGSGGRLVVSIELLHRSVAVDLEEFELEKI